MTTVAVDPAVLELSDDWELSEEEDQPRRSTLPVDLLSFSATKRPLQLGDPVGDMLTVELITEGPFHQVDLTAFAQGLVRQTGVTFGQLLVFCPHTTAVVLLNERERGLQRDALALLERLVPEGGWHHDDMSQRIENLTQSFEPANGHAHLRAMLLGAASPGPIPIEDGTLGLGRWQRILLHELDSARPRQVRFQVTGWRTTTEA